MELSLEHRVLAVAGVIVGYCVCLAVYRLYLSPLSKFPGSKLAIVTLWFEFYYDVIKRGRYQWKIAEMHETYGPIIRINPFELHVNDPDFYDELYVNASVRKTAKYPWATKMFGTIPSTLNAEAHEVHRIRRAAISPFLSKASVQRLEPTIQLEVDKLMTRLQNLRATGTITDLSNVCSSFTSDVISQYAFSKPFGFMDYPDFAPFWHKTLMKMSEASLMRKQFPWLEPILESIPRQLVEVMNPSMKAVMDFQDARRDQVIQVKADLARGEKPPEKRTIFYDILTNDQVRPQEKETDYLQSEAQLLIAAGAITTAHTLDVTIFNVINSPEVLEKLQTDLRTVMPDHGSKPKWAQLEQLPYLNAVVKEGLRVAYGATHRLQRVSYQPLQFHEWTIPAGTPVGMSALLMHDNPTIFPNPHSFQPERWLDPANARLSKYLVSFSKGSRGYAGANLAYCEIYLTLTSLFAPDRFRFELFETDASDAAVAHDFFSAAHSVESKGIRVLIK